MTIARSLSAGIPATARPAGDAAPRGRAVQQRAPRHHHRHAAGVRAECDGPGHQHHHRRHARGRSPRRTASTACPASAPASTPSRSRRPGFLKAQRAEPAARDQRDAAARLHARGVGRGRERDRRVEARRWSRPSRAASPGRVDRMLLQEMPLSGRNLYNLLALQPGVTGRGFSASISGGGGADDSFAGESAPRINASGQRDEANNFTVDDTSTNGVARGGITNLTPNTESVEEVRVVVEQLLRRRRPQPRRADPGDHQGRHQRVPRQRLLLLHRQPALGAERLRDLGARVQQEPVRLQPGRSDRAQPPVLLHLVRGAAADRRARLDVHRRDPGVPQLHPADAAEQHRGAAVEELRARRSIPTSNFRDLGSPAPGANVDRAGRRHPRCRHARSSCRRDGATATSSAAGSTTS